MDKLTWLWLKGAELYRTKWTRDWGEVPTETLEQLLGKLSANDIKLGFAECIKKAQDGSEWPPVPITFISMCKTAGIDVDGSFMRLTQRKEPLNVAEVKTRGEVGFNCRGMDDSKARKLWEKHYRQNYLMMKEGKLAADTRPAITANCSARETDTMRDNFVPTAKQSVQWMDMLNKIRGAKK